METGYGKANTISPEQRVAELEAEVARLQAAKDELVSALYGLQFVDAEMRRVRDEIVASLTTPEAS